MNWNQKIETGQRAVVMGMGVSGRAAVAFLISKGAKVFVTDSREFTDLPEKDQLYLRENKIVFEGGAHTKKFMSQGDFIVISPGVPTDLPLLKELRDTNIPVFGELALAAPYLRECVVAVTGTNGKTTVTSLVGKLLQAAGRKVFVGGNIGTPVLDYLRIGERAEFLVLELSSFQLESAGSFCPHIGILLNITPDHLDRHKDMIQYAAAKMKMFVHQKATDKAVICNNDPMCQQVKPLLTVQEVYCFGNYESACAAKGNGREFTITINGQVDKYALAGTALDSHTGLLNSQAAVLAVSLLGCEKTDINKGLRSFTPAKHRLQLVRRVDGVDYYNDSKATNTGAVLSALASFPGNIILLAGGRDKGEEYTVLKELVLEKVKAMVLFGEAAKTIDSSIGNASVSHHVSSMEEAVNKAADIASPGDIVLLAPACSSFDMFDNYCHRGDVFMKIVQNLPQKQKEEAA